MEKIYVEENQTKKTNTRLSVSVGVSFAVAFIAIVSILFVSLSGTTYSQPVDTLPDKIVAQAPTVKLVPTAPASTNPAYQIREFEVEPYSAQGITQPVYCVESARNYSAATLNRAKTPISEEAFIYLLTKVETMNIDASKITYTGVSEADAIKYVKNWVGQTAIWMYLGSTPNHANSKTRPGSTTQLYVANNKNDLYNVNALSVQSITLDPIGTINTTGSFYKNLGLDKVLDTAIASYGKNDVINAGLSKASNKFVVSGKYLKSDKITVKLGAQGLISEVSDTYEIKLKGAPEGTKVFGINKSGKEEEIKDLTKVSYSTFNQFYVYVPTRKVKEKETISFSVSIVGNFEVYTGYYYEPESGTAQTVTTIDKFTYSKNPGVDLTVVLAPDTGVDTSAIMYIVGMVVLLSGLGILYVNIKNQKQYQ